MSFSSFTLPHSWEGRGGGGGGGGGGREGGEGRGEGGRGGEGGGGREGGEGRAREGGEGRGEGIIYYVHEISSIPRYTCSWPKEKAHFVSDVVSENGKHDHQYRHYDNHANDGNHDTNDSS